MRFVNDCQCTEGKPDECRSQIVFLASEGTSRLPYRLVEPNEGVPSADSTCWTESRMSPSLMPYAHPSAYMPEDKRLRSVPEYFDSDIT